MIMPTGYQTVDVSSQPSQHIHTEAFYTVQTVQCYKLANKRNHKSYKLTGRGRRYDKEVEVGTEGVADSLICHFQVPATSEQ